MLFLACVLVGVAAGLLGGGSFRNLETFRFRMPWTVFLALLLQLAAALRMPPPLASLILLASYLLILTFACANRLHRGMGLIILGTLLNLAVIAANGRMPVSAGALELVGRAGELLPGSPSGKHLLMEEGTRLPFLGDFIPLPIARAVYSPGDIAIYAGVLVLTRASLLPRGKHAPQAGSRTRSSPLG